MAAVARASAPAQRLGLGRLLGINALYFGHGAHWQAILVVTLPVGAALIAPTQAAATIGRVTAAGAIFATLVPVAAGWLSDHTASRWGRRRPWFVGGTLVNVIGLIVLGLAGSLPQLVAGFLIVQISNNAAGAAYSAVIPDVVPEGQRGQASGLLGMMNQAGTIVGVALVGFALLAWGSSRSGLLAAYAGIALIMLATLVVTTVAVREPPSIRVGAIAVPPIRGQALMAAAAFVVAIGALLALLLMSPGRATLGLAAIALGAAVVTIAAGLRLPGLRRFFSPFRSGDFFWVFGTRALVMLGINSIVPFIGLYFRDVVGVRNFGAASSFWLLAVIGGAILPSIVFGMLSDRTGRRKLFVYLSSGLQAAVVSVLLFTLIPSLPAMYALGIVFGIGYGAYYAIDFALVCDVLPQRETAAAKDIGLWHSALTIPQVISPALMGPILQRLNENGGNLGYRVVFAGAALWFVMGTVLVSRIKGVR